MTTASRGGQYRVVDFWIKIEDAFCGLGGDWASLGLADLKHNNGTIVDKSVQNIADLPHIVNTTWGGI